MKTDKKPLKINLLRRPFVTLSYAQSLDGSIAYQGKKRFLLSGRKAQVLTHKLRNAHDAILVGIGTVISDDPRLTARVAGGKNPQPVILDSSLKMPLNSFLLNKHPKGPWIISNGSADRIRKEELTRKGARIFSLNSDSNQMIDLKQMLRLLAKQGVRNLMVEGGAKVITSFLSQRIVDYIVITVSPVFLGGMPVLNAPVSLLSLDKLKIKKFGNDLVLSGYPVWRRR